jgi:N6-adenosine-specific RNA methylase IME4
MQNSNAPSDRRQNATVQLRLAELAADDCVLFLWTTVPLCKKTFEVLRAWDFEYKSGLVWDKEIPGLGYWVRGQHELLLIATRDEVEGAS